jgi:hypothetical protein
MRFDPQRLALNADKVDDLSLAAAAIHQRILPTMPGRFHGELQYERHRTFKSNHASALGTMEKALRQGIHVDTDVEGYSVMVAIESDVKLVVLKNSLTLTRRVNELWKIFNRCNKLSPGAASSSEWWEYCCWRQLKLEGWGDTLNLEPVMVVIPKGHALIFSTWLLHAGAEWLPGDHVGCNRMHFYLTPFDRDGTSAVKMQDRDGVRASFSPVLHFLPLPPCDAPKIVRDLWKLQIVADKVATLRGRLNK